MNIITFLAFSLGLAAPYAVAAPASAPDISFPNAARLASRAIPTIINAPGVNDATDAVASVYACSDAYFAGRCVFIRSFPDQCVQTPATPNANDVLSSVVPVGPWKCRFFVQFACDESQGFLDLQYPGYSNLNQTAFNDKLSSYSCSLDTSLGIIFPRHANDGNAIAE